MIKSGDKVKIKSLDWYNNKKDVNGNINYTLGQFTPSMSLYCGKNVTITKQVDLLGFMIKEDNEKHVWTKVMFECDSLSKDEILATYEYLRVQSRKK